MTEQNKTVEERATELANQVDFEKRSKAFGKDLDDLIKKHQVGLILTLNYGQDGIKPQIQRIDMKLVEAAAKERAAVAEVAPVKKNGKKK